MSSHALSRLGWSDTLTPPLRFTLPILGLGAAAGLAGAAFPLIAVAVAAIATLIVAVFIRPVFAAYVLIGLTPLLVGIERGRVFPVLRAHEALVLLLVATLLARQLVRHLLAGHTPRPRFKPLDGCVMLLLLTGSVMPLLWMFARDRPMADEDLFYAARLWHYAGVYLLIRLTVRTPAQFRAALVTSLAVGAIVSALGIFEVIGLFGVPHFLASYYSLDTLGSGVTRATATTGSPFAFSDILIFNLAIAIGWLLETPHHRGLLFATSGILIFGIVASGSVSGLIGVLVMAIAVGIVCRRSFVAFLALLPVLAAASFTLKAVILERLANLDPAVGLPVSWLGRVFNLRSYFWPELFSHFNYFLGVRPAAELPGRFPWEGVVYIESGHTWLLWIGGLPFFLAFWMFALTAVRSAARLARFGSDVYRVAGIASFSAILVLIVLMSFDPHLTLRGSADLNFSLLALVAGAAPMTVSLSTEKSALNHP